MSPGVAALYVDTGPMLDRAWASARESDGSAFERDPSERGRGASSVRSPPTSTSGRTARRQPCGTCVRRIAACPTGAITAPYQVDRADASATSIEHEGPIPIDSARDRHADLRL
jgi:hypothetical protein